MSYIVNFSPVKIEEINVGYYSQIENKIMNRESLSMKEVNDFLDAIIYIVRYKINNNLDNYDNKCDLAVSILYHYLKKLDCKVFSLTTQTSITNNIVGHSFLTIELNVNGHSQNYLIDPTYIQFFRKDKCGKENYYISPLYKDMVLLTPDPGYFIKETMKNNAQILINHGHILLNEDNAQMYGDSFYNTKTGVNYGGLTYKSISGKIYINAFTQESDSVSKTEEELSAVNLNIIPFQELLVNHKER